MNHHIFWISSYPKSGNTLLRAIISSIFFTNDGVFNFELLKKIVNFEDIARLENIQNLHYKNFSGKSVKEKSSIIYDNLNQLQEKKNLGFAEDFAFFKTHFSALNFDKKKFLINNFVRGIFYIVRDPRDVCVSWSKHANVSIDESIDFLTNKNSVIKWPGIEKNYNYSKNLPVFISSWDQHVNSWNKEIINFPHLILKYEELVYDKENIIIKIINFFEKNYKLKVTNKDYKIKNILTSTDFKILQKEENENGFIESVGNQFFSVGRKDQWKKKLSKKQIFLLESKFDKVMSNYGYQLGVEI